MAAIGNNLNQGPNLDAFRERSNGDHNVGELKLENGVLKIVNNHVWKTGQNDEILSADENREVRTALFRAFRNEINSLEQGESGKQLLRVAEEILLGDNAGKSLTREVTHQLCEAERLFRDEVNTGGDHSRELRSDLAANVKALAERNVRPVPQGVMRSSRGAAFRLTVNERRDRLLDLLGECYLGKHNYQLKERCEELKAFLLVGTDEEVARIKADDQTLDKLNRYRAWLRKFDAKAEDANGKTVSDEKALADLKGILDVDQAVHGLPSADRRKSAVEGLLKKLFGLKGGKGKVEQGRFRSLLIDGKTPANAFERQVVKFRPWLTGGGVVLMEGADGERSEVPDDVVLEKLQAILASLSGSFEGMPVENRQGFVREALDEIFNDKGGEGDAAKARLSVILFGEDTPDNLTSDEKEIAKFRDWLHDYYEPMTDENGAAMSDSRALDQLKALLKGAGDSVGPISQKERKAAVVSVLNKLDEKGGYGWAVKNRLSDILFVPGLLDNLTSDEQEIAKFKDWVNKFDVPMTKENGEVMTDREALEQLTKLLSAKVESITPMSKGERGKAVQALLEKYFSQGGIVLAVKKNLERILDANVPAEELTSDEKALLEGNQEFGEFRIWRDNSGAAVELDGQTLSDQEALDRLEELFKDLAESITPMSVEERQDAAKQDLEELFKAEGDYGPEMKAAKERLQTILFGDEERYGNDTERALGLIYRKWLHDANAVAEYAGDMGSAEALKLKSTRLSDGEGRRHLRDLLESVAKETLQKASVQREKTVQKESAEERKSKLLGIIIADLQKGKQRRLDDLKGRYNEAWASLSGELKKMPIAEARALEWWQRTHQPDFAGLWSDAVDDGKLEVEDVVDPEEVKEKFAKALNESLDGLINARIKALKDMVDKVKGHMASLVLEARSRIGNLQALKTASTEQKMQVLEALPEELERRVPRYDESSDDDDKNIPLYRLLTGDETAVARLLGEVEVWAKGRIDELRTEEARKQEEIQKQTQERRQTCLQEGRKEALRRIAKVTGAFAMMTLSDEDLERSIGLYPALSLDGVSNDKDIQGLLESRAATLKPSGQSDADQDAFDQLKGEIVTKLVEKFTGKDHTVESGQIASYAEPIREARRKEFSVRGDLDTLANRLTDDVAKELADYFKPSLWEKNPDLGKRWLSSEAKPAEFDEGFMNSLSAFLKKPVKVCMQSIYVNHGVVTEENEDIKRECERIGNIAKNLLEGLSALYQNLAVDKKNFRVSGLILESKTYFVVAEGKDEKTVRAVMRDEALKSLYTIMEDPHSYLKDPAKMKGAISAAARNVVENDSVVPLWNTHKHDERNAEVYEALLKLW